VRKDELRTEIIKQLGRAFIMQKKTSVSLILLALCCVISLSGCDSRKKAYNEAEKLYSNGKWQEAREVFAELGDYQDAADQVKNCDYNIAENAFNSGDYQTAMNMYAEMMDFKDARAHSHEIMKRLAGQMFIDKCTEGLTSFDNYVNTSAQKIITAALTAGSFSIDYGDKDYKATIQCGKDITAMKKEYQEVFTDELMDKLDDENMKKAHKAFIETADYAIGFFEATNVQNYIYSMGGVNTTVKYEPEPFGSKMSQYTNLGNNL